MFTLTSKYINLETAKREQIENFLNNLNRNIIKKNDGSNFSGSTKADIKKFLKQYFKHTRGEDENYPKEVSWIKATIGKDEKPKEKPTTSQDDIMKVAAQFDKLEYRILTLMFFDSGFRKSEMFSALKKDLTWDVFDEDGNKCFWIKCNESKTEPRTIPIQLFTEDIKAFVNGVYYKSLNNDNKLFNVNYGSYLKMLGNASSKAISIKLNIQCLRHSSATLYAQLLHGDLIALANRYGWSYSAKELKTYVRRSKSAHLIGAKKVFSSELLKLKEENQKQQERMDKLEKAIAVLTTMVTKKN